MSARLFDSLRKSLLQSYHGSKYSKFIMGQEFTIDFSRETDDTKISSLYLCQLTYLRCKNSAKIIDFINSTIKISSCSTDNYEFFEENKAKEFTGLSSYEFCDDHDFILYTIQDCSDCFIGMRFDIDSKCSWGEFNVFVDFVCEMLSKVFQWCHIDPNDSGNSSGTLACDTVFVLQRIGLPNDLIKIIDSY